MYAASVVFGRIYSGMHSVTDCLGGIALAYVQHLTLAPLYNGTMAYAQNPHISSMSTQRPTGMICSS